MTPEELDAALTRAYNEGRDAEWARMLISGKALPMSYLERRAELDRAGRLAVARYSAQMQAESANVFGMSRAPLWMDE